jgi:radical SAM protein with 4Fe4S-binding SPASM domain
MTDKYSIESHKLIYHPERVAQWYAAGDDWEKLKKVYPIYVEISPSGACNHRCHFCSFDYLGYKTQFLTLKTMREIIPEMASLGVKSVLCSGEGEPLLNKEIIPISCLIKESGIDLAFATNAVLLDECFVEEVLQYISWLKVSIAAGTPQTYAKIHRTKESDFNLVIQNLKRAVKWRENNSFNCTLGAQMMLLPENASELELLAKICRDELGLDYLVVKPYSHHKSSITTKYKNIDYSHCMNLESQLKGLNSPHFSLILRSHTIKKYVDEERAYPTCYSTPFFWAHIMANGDVYGCSSYLQDARFLYGNINNQSFKETWESKRRKDNFFKMCNSFDISQCRKNCRMDEINRYLWRLKSPAEHVNFI